LHALAPGRAATPTLAFPVFSFEALNTVLHLSELSDQLDVTLESSKISNWLSPGSRRPKAMQSNKDYAVYAAFFSSKKKWKPEG
jgi:hypothetical protein